MLSSRETLRQICGHFKAPIKYCFGYGSGVLSQGTASSRKARQIDMIFGVENPAEWHHQNIEQNSHHYSGLRYLGSSAVAWTQTQLGAGVYFNPFVQLAGQQVKYGIVDVKTLVDDLVNWRTLYLAGRMQKPVKVVVDDPRVAGAQKHNLCSVMSTALLLLPNEFSELDLYTKIAAVSYMGDVRMAFAENPRKVQNIVNHQFLEFRRLYSPLFLDLGIQGASPVPTISNLTEGTGQHNGAIEGVGPLSKGWALSQLAHNEDALISNLPKRFRGIVTKGGSKQVRQLRVSNAVARIIKYPSFSQSCKGLVTAGLTRSFNYMVAKLGKRFGSN